MPRSSRLAATARHFAAALKCRSQCAGKENVEQRVPKQAKSTSTRASTDPSRLLQASTRELEYAWMTAIGEIFTGK